MVSLNSGAATYSYDADGQRSVKSVGSDTTEYIYVGGEPIAERKSTGDWSDYIFASGRRLARADGAAPSATTYYHADHLGSARLTTTSFGYPAWSGTFLPFGQEWNPQATTNHYKFEGKERDAESGLDDFGARYYSSAMGRWASADWSSVPVPVPYANLTNPQTLNLYSMVGDNPETFADLDGHATHCYGEKLRLAECHSDNPESAKENTNAASQSANQNAQDTKDVSTATAATAATTTTETTAVTAVEKTAQSQIDKVVKPLIESAAEEALPAIGIASKVFGAALGAVIELAAAPATARDEDMLNKGKVGPSGKPMVHNKDFPTKKRAKDAAKNAGGGSPLKHPSPKQGSPHFHPTDRNGDKIPGVHYNYPD